MEHLENVLKEMGENYKNNYSDIDLFRNVKIKIKKKKEAKKTRRVLGILLMTVFMIFGLVFSENILPTKQLGKFFSVYVYLSYCFVFMSFIIILIINSQDLLGRVMKKVLGKNLVDKVNHHNCYFFEDNNSEKRRFKH